MFDVDNRYERSILISSKLNPVPKVIYFLAPLSSFSPKYPTLNAKESLYKYSKPKAKVISLISH